MTCSAPAGRPSRCRWAATRLRSDRRMPRLPRCRSRPARPAAGTTPTATTCRTARSSTRQPNGECGQWNNLAFGTNLVPNRNAQDAIEGFNLQAYNWQASATVQHELRPGMALNVGYFRTWYGAFQATRNLAVNPATDYDEFCITAPVDCPPAQQRRAALRPVRPQAGEVRPGRQPRDAVVELRHAQPGVQRRRRHHDRAIRARRAGGRRPQRGPNGRRQLRRA